jgi:trigger factor
MLARSKAIDFLADCMRQSEERARQSLALDALALRTQLGLSAKTDEDVRHEFEEAHV